MHLGRLPEPFLDASSMRDPGKTDSAGRDIRALMTRQALRVWRPTARGSAMGGRRGRLFPEVLRGYDPCADPVVVDARVLVPSRRRCIPARRRTAHRGAHRRSLHPGLMMLMLMMFVDE